jgi:hypothetical protein
VARRAVTRAISPNSPAPVTVKGPPGITYCRVAPTVR